MEKEKWYELEIGGIITRSGSSLDYKTGSWRGGLIPIWNKEKCINCLLCYIYCPEGSIIVNKEAKVEGINYDYCKGCGICQAECPEKVKAITMVEET